MTKTDEQHHTTELDRTKLQQIRQLNKYNNKKSIAMRNHNQKDKTIRPTTIKDISNKRCMIFKNKDMSLLKTTDEIVEVVNKSVI